MTSTDNAGRADGLSVLPPIWVGIVMAMCAYGLWTSWPLTYSSDLPDDILYYLYASVAEAVLLLLWGIGLLVLAANRSSRFAGQFTAWGVVLIALIVLREAYALAIPDFIFSLRSSVQSLAEIAITVFCIFILRHKVDATAAPALTPALAGASRPSALASILLGFLGLVLGGVVGFGLGLGAGVVISEVTDMSCFEGACGFFAFFVGIGGLVLGAIAGLVFAIWRVNRRRSVAA